jgi:hypothetical protein
VAAFRQYVDDVKAGAFPDASHSYHMKAGELQRLNDLLQDRSA